MTLRLEYSNKDDLAKGIWANKIGKVAFNLWRVRWRNLPTKDKLIGRGMTISRECILCDRKQETIDHLFAKCEYTKWVLKEAMEATRALVKLEAAASTFEDTTQELNKVTLGSPAWGLQWNMYGIVLFHIWKQRNQRRMQSKIDTKQEVLRRSMEMTKIGFDGGRFKRKCRMVEEQRDALLMLIYDRDGGG